MTDEARTTPPLIEMEGLMRVYGSGDATVYALNGVDLSIDKSEFVAIMGPSGSGQVDGHERAAVASIRQPRAATASWASTSAP